jgi:hypothetical protein
MRKQLDVGARIVARMPLCLALAAAPRAATASQWSVMVGGRTPDYAAIANGFFARELTIQTRDTATWRFEVAARRRHDPKRQQRDAQNSWAGLRRAEALGS